MSDTIPENAPQKQCPKCKQTFPSTRDFFYTDRNKKSGLTSYCRFCQGYQPIKVKPTQKRCNECKEMKDVSLFYCRSHDGLIFPYCKNCVSLRSKKFRDAHKEQYNARAREYNKIHDERNKKGRKEYYENNKEKFKEHNRHRRAYKKSVAGKHTNEQIREQYARQKGKCYYCCSKIKWGGHHIDHTFPLSRVAGTDIPANDISYIVITCPTCNLKKGDKFPWEWPEGGRLL